MSYGVCYTCANTGQVLTTYKDKPSPIPIVFKCRCDRWNSKYQKTKDGPWFEAAQYWNEKAFPELMVLEQSLPKDNWD